jgi:hypothetical protein
MLKAIDELLNIAASTRVQSINQIWLQYVHHPQFAAKRSATQS